MNVQLTSVPRIFRCSGARRWRRAMRGYKGGGAVQTESNNDDAYAVLLPVADDAIFINGFELLDGL